MKLLEYEAKNILELAGIPVPTRSVVWPEDSNQRLPDFPLVVKSQVPVGGRGKAGGVVVVENQETFNETVARIATLDIKGCVPQVVIAEPKLSIASEHYISLVINRETSSVQLIVHPEGGIEVESQTGFSIWDMAYTSGDNDFRAIAVAVAESYGSPDTARELQEIIEKLYECFIETDATLLEINPLVRTTDGSYICADAKMELDDAAAFRHPEWNFEDKPHDVNFVTLDAAGEIATIANGAGLAMATVDAVAAHSMRPANFLDVGGGANKDSVLKSFNQIVQYQNVKAIVINIFAGITRCDEVANAIIAARAEISSLPPLFIRLAGTNFEEAQVILEREHIPTLPTLEECLLAAKKEVAS